VGVPSGWSLKLEWGCWRRQFLAIEWLLLRKLQR